jgi:DNA-binding winged helix-turn-helix (wHTH) protein
MGLRAGADCVLPRDLPDEEVVASILALVRREAGSLNDEIRYLESERIQVDLLGRVVRVDGAAVSLTATEFTLLVALMRQHDKTVTTQQLISRIWGAGTLDGINTLRIFIRRLRIKLGDPARCPDYIFSVRGVGYRFVPQVIELVDAGTPKETEQTAALVALSELATDLARCTDIRGVADTFVGTLRACGVADSVAVHSFAHGHLQLEAQEGLPTQWAEKTQKVPVTSKAYVIADAVARATEVQIVGPPIRRYSVTGRFWEKYRWNTMLILPYSVGGEPAGCVGFTRQVETQWSPEPLAFVRACVSLYGSQVAARTMESA